MKAKNITILYFLVALCLALAACGKEQTPARSDAAIPTDPAQVNEAALPDGVYSAAFNTDSSMFHVNEALAGKGTLTVKDGQMTIHVTLPSKNTVNLFLGTAEEAQAAGAVLLQPTIDKVTYADGETEEVHGFDIPVPYLDEEFDCALIGAKGVWYDHKVSVSNAARITVDGDFTMEVTMTGGTGRASIQSPANITVENGVYTAEIVWSSPNYEYMTVDGVRYDPVNTDGNSTFRIPITPDTDMTIQALTTAMSEPHLIEYVLHFDASTFKQR